VEPNDRGLPEVSFQLIKLVRDLHEFGVGQGLAGAVEERELDQGMGAAFHQRQLLQGTLREQAVVTQVDEAVEQLDRTQADICGA